MNIEHKTTPVEHWIVDGKAYRLATEADVGNVVYRSDTSFERALSNGNPIYLDGYFAGEDFPFFTGGRWRFAYIQDDSLLTPQRVPVPALGDGWFLLTAEDGEIKSGDKIKAGYKGIVTWTDLPHGHKWAISTWIRDGHEAARYFGPSKEPEPIAEIGPQPTKSIDWTKPVRTKGTTKPVRIVCTDGPGDYPVVGFEEGDSRPVTWTLFGKYNIDGPKNDRDLENVPPEPKRIQREIWVNIYPEGITCDHQTREDADAWSGEKRLACVKVVIDCIEGEGLNVQP